MRAPFPLLLLLVLAISRVDGQDPATTLAEEVDKSNAKDYKELWQSCSATLTKQSATFGEMMDRCVSGNSTSKREDVKARDCLDVLRSGQRTSGVYRVRPIGWKDEAGFEVLCDMDTDGGGWTVFQRRGDFGNRIDYFYRTWDEYKRGFGILTEEFWIGNDRLSALTTQRSYELGAAYELRVDMMDMDLNKAYARYKEFRVEDESQQFLLNVEGYSGDAGDSLEPQNAMKFTTKDRDNDLYVERNAAVEYKAGWWYTAGHQCNLNGMNRKGPFNATFADGISWNLFRSYQYSLHSTEMKLRPRVHVKLAVL